MVGVYIAAEIGAMKLVKALQLTIFTDHSKAVLLLWIIFVIYVLCLLCFRICSLLPCDHFWERAELLAFVCDALLSFCHFPMWYSESGVVIDCIDS